MWILNLYCPDTGWWVLEFETRQELNVRLAKSRDAGINTWNVSRG